MSRLTYDQKLILLLYELFYGRQYPFFDGGHDEDKTRIHINAQKMCFLLQLNGIDIGEFGYSWNYHGPFSPGLLAVLRSLDSRADLAADFYNSENRPEDYLSKADMLVITSLIKGMALSEHRDDIDSWMELLGSMAYLSNSLLPGEDFVRVTNELKRRKSKFDNNELNRCAWEILGKAGMLKLA